MPRKARLSLIHASLQASRLSDFRQSAPQQHFAPPGLVCLSSNAVTGRMLEYLSTSPGVHTLSFLDQPPWAAQLISYQCSHWLQPGLTGSSVPDRGPFGIMLLKSDREEKELFPCLQCLWGCHHKPRSYGLQPGSNLISTTYLSHKEDVTDMHHLKGKK